MQASIDDLKRVDDRWELAVLSESSPDTSLSCKILITHGWFLLGEFKGGQQIPDGKFVCLQFRTLWINF